MSPLGLHYKPDDKTLLPDEGQKFEYLLKNLQNTDSHRVMCAVCQGLAA